MDWPTYLAEISTNHSEIARAADVHSGTVGRWFKGTSRPEASAVIAVARAFDRSPVIALVVAGYLSRDEVEGQVQITPGMSLAEFSELEIAEELVRRIEAGQTTEISDAPLEVDHPAWANVSGAPEDEQADSGRDSDAELADLPEEVRLFVTLTRDEMKVRDENNVEYPDVETAYREFRNELAHNGLHMEDLKHAAKSDAREVEEDQHTP